MWVRVPPGVMKWPSRFFKRSKPVIKGVVYHLDSSICDCDNATVTFTITIKAGVGTHVIVCDECGAGVSAKSDNMWMMYDTSGDMPQPQPEKPGGKVLQLVPGGKG